MSAGFVHLHTHSNFSFMDGACPLPALVARAAELGMPALALTDHQGLSGAVRFYKACKDAGIAPIVGAEVVVEAAGVLGEEALLDGSRYVGSARALEDSQVAFIGREELLRLGVPLAVAGSALLFALVHLPAYGVAAFPVDLGAGLLLSWQRWASGTWTVPAATHAVAVKVHVHHDVHVQLTFCQRPSGGGH